MPCTPAQIRASVKSNRAKDSITLRPSKELGAAIRAAAAQSGNTVQGYILDAVKTKMSVDSQKK